MRLRFVVSHEVSAGIRHIAVWIYISESHLRFAGAIEEYTVFLGLGYRLNLQRSVGAKITNSFQLNAAFEAVAPLHLARVFFLTFCIESIFRGNHTAITDILHSHGCLSIAVETHLSIDAIYVWMKMHRSSLTFAGQAGYPLTFANTSAPTLNSFLLPIVRLCVCVRERVLLQLFVWIALLLAL